MRPLQAWARSSRIRFFISYLHPGEHVLEVGPGEGWFRKAIAAEMSTSYLTIDTHAPANIAGDVRNWRQHGLEAGSFDVIVAFEVVEHTPCLPECRELLKPGGRLLITTPMPQFDWLLKLFENLRLIQARTSEHSYLTSVRSVPGFILEKARYPFGVGQWVVLRKIDPTTK